MTPGVAAIFDALRFDRPSPPVDHLTADDLAFADRVQLTPLLARLALPSPARTHVDAAIARNALRVQHVAAAYQEIAPSFEHLLLKGVTHIPDFVEEARLRVQYDLDLYVPPAQKEKARDALIFLGYEPIGGMEDLAMDHLPTMIRKTGWQWRGDYFDPDLPPAVEVHFRFWDAATERIRVDGLDQFWTRREAHQLALPDRLGYAALHLTRHLLRGQVRPAHVWEIARFLHLHHDPHFWREWYELHPPSLRRLEAVAFLLAQSWFACALAPEPAGEIAALSPRVHRWFQRYRWSALESNFNPNKHELWLHTSLLDSSSDRVAILRRRLIPSTLAGPVDGVHVPRAQLTLARRVKSFLRNGAYRMSRAIHHARLFVPTVSEGVRWWLSRDRKS